MTAWNDSYLPESPKPWESGHPVIHFNKLVSDVPKCRVLSIGCGTGIDEKQLADYGFDVTAIDLSERAIEIARTRSQVVNWIVGDIFERDDLGAFDLVFDRCCYHHLRYSADYTELLMRHTVQGSHCFIASWKQHQAPGVLEEHMKADFEKDFETLWLKSSALHDMFGNVVEGTWALLMKRITP